MLWPLVMQQAQPGMDKRTPIPPIFDGHNDAILRLWMGGIADANANFRSSAKGHIDLERARAGHLIGGFFAMFAPPTGPFKMPDFSPPYDIPLPPMLDQIEALEMITGQADVLIHLHDAGLLTVCTNRAQIDTAVAKGTMAAIMHLEGAEAIDPDLEALDQLFAKGLRSLGPVWSRQTIFGHGVPFRYPSDADIGPGLTDIGKSLVARCAALGVIVDTSHLNMAGFWDVGAAGLPLVATHSNAHAVSPGARNLTDPQLRAIGETGGIVGLNYGTMFLRADGRASPEGGLDAAMRHLSHMLELAGEDHVALGSDFDGAPMPQGLEDASKLDTLRKAMSDHHFGDDLIARICSKNWLNFIERHLG